MFNESEYGPYRCQECGSPLIPTHSGSTCSEGHGKICPKLPMAVARANYAEVAGIPTAIQTGGKYYVRDVLCVPGTATSKAISGVIAEIKKGEIYAIHEGRIRNFIPVEDKS